MVKQKLTRKRNEKWRQQRQALQQQEVIRAAEATASTE
jgi:hypothetical protein